MGDMLTQEEISALLAGDTSSNDLLNDPEISAALEVAENIDALADETPQESSQAGGPDKIDLSNVSETKFGDVLTAEQKDILGEIGNISMGTAATTLFTLLGHKVLITTPRVKVLDWKTLSGSYDRPCVGIRVKYKTGLQGSNILVLKERDVKVISSLMMGEDGTVTEPVELNDLDLSAIGEAMNQMVGSSSTSLSSVVDTKIDISTPEPFILNFQEDSFFDEVGYPPDEIIACTSFRMEIGTMIDSEIMQIVPVDFAKDIVNKMMRSMMGYSEEEAPPPPSTAPSAAAPAAPPAAPVQAAPPPSGGIPMQQTVAQQVAYPKSDHVIPEAVNINAQPAQFQTLDITDLAQQKENIGIIMDVPLEVTVELGRTSKKIKEILEFAPGTIVDLDKLAGEPIDILVNGKFVASGEVVVVDENFAVRVTDIISVDKRI